MTDTARYLGRMKLYFAVWVDAGSAGAVEAVLRHISLERLIASSPSVVDWEGARYDVDPAEGDARDEPVKIHVLRTFVETGAYHRVLLGVAYEILRTGERYWNDAYADMADAAYRRGELAPIWRHPCEQCVYLGQYAADGREYDLYFSESCALGAPTPLARWSDAPDDMVGAEMTGDLREEATRRINLWRAGAQEPG